MSRAFFLSVTILSVAFIACGQTHKSDTSFVTQATTYAIDLYTASMGRQSGLYNGSAYTEYQSLKEEHPYFIPDWTNGTISYDGEVYKNVPLLYDLSIDKVITENAFTLNKIQLVEEKVGSFILNKHRFVYLADHVIPTGFYEVVHDSITKVFVRWQKAQQERNTVTEVLRTFEEKKGYYIYKDNTYFSVRNKKSVLAVFNNRKTELKKFISKSRLKFNHNRIEGIRLIAAQYDRLHP